MVFVSLIFSVFTFYKNLRNLLFAEITESDAHNIMIDTPIHRGERKDDLRCQYFTLQALINLILWIFVIVVIIGQKGIEPD